MATLCHKCNRFYNYADNLCSKCYNDEQNLDILSSFNTFNIKPLSRNDIVNKYTINDKFHQLLKFDNITFIDFLYAIKSYNIFFKSNDIHSIYNLIHNKFNYINDDTILNVIHSRILDRWHLNNEFYMDIHPNNFFELKQLLDNQYEMKLLEYQMMRLNN